MKIGCLVGLITQIYRTTPRSSKHCRQSLSRVVTSYYVVRSLTQEGWHIMFAFAYSPLLSIVLLIESIQVALHSLFYRFQALGYRRLSESISVYLTH